MTLQLAYKQLLASLYELYDNREAANIADWIIEHVSGQNKMNRILNKELPLTSAQQEDLQHKQSQLMQHKPVQYVLNESWFAGLKLYVNDSVLIPRPETEELVDWIVKDCRNQHPDDTPSLHILDVGTGSGCIALALKKQLPGCLVSAIDISSGALEVAKRNGINHQLNINFIQANFLSEYERQGLTKYDIIVSNPPYIKRSEAGSMSNNVLQFEPALALFVPDEDALIFYEAIADFASTHLAQDGAIYVEINEMLGDAVINLFRAGGLSQTMLKKDMQGKHRMIKANNEDKPGSLLPVVDSHYRSGT